MKKIIALAAILFATSASALEVDASSHDMANFVGGAGATSVCYYCHAAHNTTKGFAPLWARNAWVNSGYTFYTSATVSVNVTTLDPVSAACMTCHDGSVAVNATIKGTFGTPTVLPSTNDAYLGKDLTNDHPVNLVWDTSKAGLGAASAISPFRTYTTSGGGSGISCASCHLVHDNANGKFLRLALTAAQDFCASCHQNK